MLNNSINLKKLKLIFIGWLVVVVWFFPISGQAMTMAQKLSGRILLDVQRAGRAWYVNPVNLRRYYLGRPNDAFVIMRELGLGITVTDLAKIPIVTKTSIVDQEDKDKEGEEKKTNDWDLARRLAGRIVLSVEEDGEAWYVNPVNLRRYYLGRPNDAFTIMRELGLGITVADLAKIHKPGLTESLDQYSSYQYKSISTSAGTFQASIVTINLADPDLKIITETANNDHCQGAGPARELIDYVGDHQGFAAINGSYFDTSATRRNYYFFPVYNTRLSKLINENQLKWWTTGPMMVFDQDNQFYYFADSRDFGSVEQFEARYGVKIQAALGNKPRLIENYLNLLIDWELDQQQLTGKHQRAAIGYLDNQIYLVVVNQATIPDLAIVMQELGMEYALNLDGGYSTALYYNDEYMIGPGRPIPNALIFTKTN